VGIARPYLFGCYNFASQEVAGRRPMVSVGKGRLGMGRGRFQVGHGSRIRKPQASKRGRWAIVQRSLSCELCCGRELSGFFPGRALIEGLWI